MGYAKKVPFFNGLLGFTETLNNGFTVQFLIDDRKRLLAYMRQKGFACSPLSETENIL